MSGRHDNCPHCGVSLVGDPIPDERRHLYGGTHFRREIGVSRFDRIVEWVCPDCGGRWPRDHTHPANREGTGDVTDRPIGVTP